MWSLSGSCFWLYRFLSVLCEVFVFSQGSVCVYFVSLSPSRPDPCLVCICLSSSCSCMVCSSTPCFSLSLFSGAGEPQTFMVWGSPCVSTSWTRSPPSTRTSSSSHSPRHRSRTCFFFFLVVVVRCRFGVVSFLVLSVSVVLSGCLCRVAVLSLFPAWPSGDFFFFWVGGVPLAAFSLCFPPGSRGVLGGFSLLFSCILHLSCT